MTSHQQWPMQAPPQHTQARAIPWWGVTTLVIAAVNQAILIYLLIAVIRAQIALAEVQRLFENFPTGLFGD